MLLASAAGWTIGGILFLIVWILIAFWPARVASRKGRSFFGYFVLSLFFFPLALILAYVLSDKSRGAH
jgi:hypothetical protein